MELGEYKQFKNSKGFQEGIEMFRKNKVQIPFVKQFWVSILMSKRDWFIYSQNPAYCKLGEELGKVKVGFLIGEKVPFGCKELTEIEKVRVQEYRRDSNILPLPYVQK